MTNIVLYGGNDKRSQSWRRCRWNLLSCQEPNPTLTEVEFGFLHSESMFTSWMEANKQYPEGRNLCYGQYVSKFVYVKRSRTWKPRKSGYTIGRLIWVSPCTGELYYLRMMLTVAKGEKCYEDIRTVSDIQYSTFRYACFAMGLLQDDR
ncbi:hypothetical protein Lal_00016730 [Lupinus albus]|nr:hypothetical protein Lal_00016730 [Lupinus albus]